MNLKEELQKLNNRLDKYRTKLKGAKDRNDREVIAQFTTEIERITKKIASLKGQQARKMGAKGGKILAMPFNRPLTKAEQADMGKLKKSVRGLVVVHPMTAMGRELDIKVVTGFAYAEF